MVYSRPAPGWKRADIEYFSPDRLEAYPTLRRRLVAVGRRREKVLSGALESSLDTPGSNVAFFSRLAFVCVSVLYRTRLRLERPTQQQHLHQQYSVGVVENIAMRALHTFWNRTRCSSQIIAKRWSVGAKISRMLGS